jgi:hypothetical protein
MGWSDAFVDALAAGASRRHRVRSLPGPVGSDVGVTDWTITGGAESLGVVLKGTGSTAGAHLSVPDWSSSIGGFTIDLVGDARPLLQRVWKGQFVVHEVSLDGGAWEPVQLGVVEALRGTDEGEWALDCLDGLAALRSRYTIFEREQPLFSLYGLTDSEAETGVAISETGGGTMGTLTTEQYDPGNEATLSVLVGTRLVGDTDTNAGRLAVVDPGAGNRFFVRFTGSTATTITGCTDSVYMRESAGPARIKAPGKVIQTVPFIEDHPLDIIRKILVSNGRSSDTPSAPANGPYNTLPRTWGYGIPEWLVDHEDIDDWIKVLSPASGSAAWTMISEMQQTDGLGFLQAWLARGLKWLTIRQGRYTVRGAVDPAGMSAALSNVSVHFGRLSGRYVVPGSLRWSAWGGSGAVEYRRIRVYTATQIGESTASTVRSQPCEDEYAIPLQDTIWSNQHAHQALLIQCAAPWVLTLCERLDVECNHPLAKGLAPGDVVLLDFAHWGGRDVTVNGGVYDGRAALVTGVDPDWWGDGPTKLTFATPPKTWWTS